MRYYLAAIQVRTGKFSEKFTAIKIEWVTALDPAIAVAQRRLDIAICASNHPPESLHGPLAVELTRAIYGSIAYLQKNSGQNAITGAQLGWLGSEYSS